MNNKTMIRFCFHIILKIMEIEEGVVNNAILDLHNSSDHSQPHSIVVKYYIESHHSNTYFSTPLILEPSRS